MVGGTAVRYNYAAGTPQAYQTGMWGHPRIQHHLSPAQVTGSRKRKKGRGKLYHTRGGVAILYRPRLSRMLQPGVECVGHNCCATLIKLAKNRVLNLVTPCIPHGTTQDGTRTIIEVNQYLDQYKVPYVWGRDFNRSTDDFEEQQVRQGHHYVVAPSDQSTCLGGVGSIIS